MGIRESGVIEGLVACIIFAIGSAFLSKSFNYVRILGKRSAEKEYAQYLYFSDRPLDLTNLFLEKISRCLSLGALWIFSAVIFSSPIWQVTGELKLLSVSFLTTIFSCSAIFTLAKPINLRQATIDPERYKRRVIRKLGEIPDNIIPKP